jgi:hypothetical protein
MVDRAVNHETLRRFMKRKHGLTGEYRPKLPPKVLFLRW